MTTVSRTTIAELASLIRPSLLRLTRLIRNQRVDMSVTLTQLSAMNTLVNHGPMSAGELATYEKVQPPSMTKVLATLEDRGLVTREPHPGDKRFIRRDDQGRIKESVDMHRSLSQDDRKKATTAAKPGEGDRGDHTPSKKKN